MQAEHPIDLSLAVNYLPACSCAAKSFLLSLGLCAVHSVRLVPAYAGIGLLLVFDRLLQGRACIMDGSSVAMGIFLAHVASEVQESISAPPAPALHAVYWGLSAEWAALAGYRLYLCCFAQGRSHQHPTARRATQNWEFLCGCVHVALCAFYRAPQPEPRGVRLARHMAFVCLCVCWMYVIGVYLRRVTTVAADSAVHFAAYFWPVLYVHPYVAAAYSCAVLFGVALHLRPATFAPAPAVFSLPPVEERRQPAPPLRLELTPGRHCCEEISLHAGGGDPEEPAAAESMEELELVFRQALMSSQASSAPSV